jgi:arylsulfatase A-like enzyme
MPVANRILFIVADDLGYGDLHPHHAWLRKPASSRVFSQFRTLSPVCSPSRAAALTGQNPSRYCVRIQFADRPAKLEFDL